MVYGDIQLTTGRLGVELKKTDSLTLEIVEAIRGIDGVNKVTTIMRNRLWDVQKDEYGEDIPEETSEVGGLEPDVLQEIINQVYDGGVTLADFNDPRNVIAVIPSDYRKDFYTREYGMDYAGILRRYEVGNTLEYTLNSAEEWFPNETDSLKIIGAVREEDIRKLLYSYSVYPILYTLQDSFEALGWDAYYNRLLVDIDDVKHDDVLLAVEQLCGLDTDINIESYKQMVKELRMQLAAIIAIVFLMLGVVALNGVMNLVGSTVMGIEQRKKELGVLMAVGLSRKEVGRMLTHEGLWVSLISSALSVVFGLGAGVGLYQLIVSGGAKYMRFTIPVIPLVSLCAVLGFVPYMVTQFAARGLQRATIVELLGRWV
jgi:cell division protein FtsX